jgi:hypothetical protein
LICFLFTSLVFVSLVGGSGNMNAWEDSFVAYRNAGKALVQMGIGSQEIILVNNPPGFFLATGRSSVVIPYPGVDELFAVARRYQAHYLLLEKDTVEGLVNLYQNPESSPSIRFLRSEGSIHIFELLIGQ